MLINKLEPMSPYIFQLKPEQLFNIAGHNTTGFFFIGEPDGRKEQFSYLAKNLNVISMYSTNQMALSLMEKICEESGTVFVGEKAKFPIKAEDIMHFVEECYTLVISGNGRPLIKKLAKSMSTYYTEL